MADKIKLVQGDQLPDITVTLTDDNNGDAPIDLSAYGTTAACKFRAAGATELTDTLPCTITDGVNGKLVIHFNQNSLADAGEYEGEIEITYPDGRVRTVYDIQKFSVRSQF